MMRPPKQSIQEAYAVLTFARAGIMLSAFAAAEHQDNFVQGYSSTVAFVLSSSVHSISATSA
jgi:hypothetical protein